MRITGDFNPLIIGDLFYEQSKPWKQIVDRCCETVLAAVQLCIESVISHTADEFTKDGLLQEIIDPAMAKRKERLEERIAEIMQPHLTGHAITYDHHFTDAIQQARQDHTRKDQEKHLNNFFGRGPEKKDDLVASQFSMSELLDALSQRSKESMDEFACSEATDSMLAYYKVRGEPCPSIEGSLNLT